MTSDHPFANYVRILGKGKSGTRHLSESEAYEAMRMILLGEAEPMQIGAFLMLLRVKEEDGSELSGFVRAARDVINAPNIQVDLDWSSYAGKRRHQPWFILSALALADAGHRIFMHGTMGHTPGRVYTEQALRSLGLNPCQNWDEVNNSLDNTNFAYMPLAKLCPTLEELVNLKPILGLRSAVNTLCRLLNPLAAEHAVQSIFHPAYADKHRHAQTLLKQASMRVIKGDGGEVEMRPEAKMKILGLDRGVLVEQQWTRRITDKAVDDDMVDEQLLRRVWHGEAHHYGEAAILGTIALNLNLLGKAPTEAEAFALATQVWDSRKPARIN